MNRLYIIPTIQVVKPPFSTAGRWPKYIHDQGVQWVMMDFGFQPTALVCVDVNDTQHTALSGQSDVITIPTNLDNTIGGALTQVQDALETLKFPSEWVTSGHTYREVLRMVTGALRVAQRVHGILGTNGNLFPSGVTLNTEYQDLNSGVKSALVQVAQEKNIDYSSLSPTSTLRAILRTFGTQLPSITMLGVTI